MNETENDSRKTEGGPAKSRPYRRAALWVAAVFGVPLTVLALATIGLLWYAKGQTFAAPDWLKERVETRIATMVSNMSIRFEDITLAVSDQWQPSLHLTELTIQPREGDAFTLSDVTGSFDLAALMDRKIRPRTISVTGTQLHFQRDAQGVYGVAFGALGEKSDGDGDGPRGAPAREAGDAILSLSELLDHPSFSSLRRIEGTSLSLRYEDRRSGRVWTVDGGRLELSRDGDDLHLRGDFAVLGGRAYATTADISIQGQMHSRAINLALRVEDAAARDIATQSAGLAWLGVLDAPISGALRVSSDEDGTIGPLYGTLQIGAGNLAPGETRDPVPFQSARTYFQYDPASLTLRFDELSLVSAWVETNAEGRIVLDQVTNGIPGSMTGQLRITELVTNPAGLYPVPLYLEGAEAEMRVNLDPFRLEVGRLDLRDRGQTLSINGWFEAEPEGWDVSLTARTDTLTADDVLELWPAAAASKTREWVARNVLDGRVRNVQLGLRSLPTSRPDIMLGFDFENLITTFMPTMPPIEAASGHAELRGDRFVITADDGWLYAPGGEGLKIAGTSFVYENTRVKQGPAKVYVKADGPLTDVLTLIDQEPLQLLTKAGRSPDLATGTASVTAELGFRLIKKLPPDQIQASYSARLTDVQSTSIVPGQTLTSPELRIKGARDRISATGTAMLGTIPVSGTWEADLVPGGGGRSHVDGVVTVSAALSDQLKLGLPPGTIGGQGPAKIRLDFQKGHPPTFKASSTLAGISVAVAPLNYNLSAAQTGVFEIEGQLTTPPTVDRISLDAPGLEAAGTISMRSGGDGLEAARFNRVRIGGWLDAPVVLTGRGKNVPPKVSVTGGSVDLTKMDLGKPSGEGGPMTVTLDRLRISEGITLRGMRGDFTNKGGLSGQFVGTLNGAAPINGTVVPTRNGSAVRVSSDNAGAALAAAGLLKKGRGGTLDLTLNPVGPKGTYDAKLKIDEIWIQDAPAMASLLSSLSVVGLLEQMSGNGILFNTAEADFRLTPSQVILRSASAVGASMGVSMDGIYDLGRKTMDMQGVVSPIYVINGIGRIFSRNKGEGLIGFNYSLAGPVAKPRVQVNPLSLFTPGMFREIFRRPPPTTN